MHDKHITLLTWLGGKPKNVINLSLPADSPVWALSRLCEIPWQFHDISLMGSGTPAHVKCYSYHASTSVTVSGGSMNSTMHYPKPKCTSSAKSRIDTNMQLTINSFRTLFPDKIFFLTLPWQLSNSLTFPGFPNKWSLCALLHTGCIPSPEDSWCLHIVNTSAR